MRRRTFISAALFAVLTLSAVVPAGAETFEGRAQKFIEGLAEKAVARLTDASLPVEEQEARFREIITEYIAFESIARWVLGGRYWRGASEDQRTRYLTLFEDLMVATYAHRFQKYSGETVEVASVRLVGESEAMVQTLLQRPNADQPLKVDWRVRESAEKFRIIDIQVEGLSMAQTQRSEFGSVLRANGGDLDALLGDLEMRLSKAREERKTEAMEAAKKS